MRTLMTEELSRVVGGTEEGRRGNNGWGNGAEGVPGSDDGATADSKFDEHWEEGDGPAPAKFDLR